jgi:hypothetical protein
LTLPPKNSTMTICAGVLTGGIDACQVWEKIENFII